MALDFTVFLPIIVFIFVGVVIALSAVISALKNRKSMGQKPTNQYRSRRYQYVPGHFSQQMELDLRLPYRRFRQLYPNSPLTYEEYKRLQMQRAFRRSMSSQNNPRMVR